MGQGNGVGDAHTWEDQGTQKGNGNGFNDSDDARNDANRKATSDQYIDDFERLYDPARLENVDALLAGADGQIDESGHMDVLPTKRTEGDETAARPLLDVPDTYSDAAREAITNETVPPGYREAVKQYFDEVE
jgi:hypothetical protein